MSRQELIKELKDYLKESFQQLKHPSEEDIKFYITVFIAGTCILAGMIFISNLLYL